jgi:hypothetical protein
MPTSGETPSGPAGTAVAIPLVEVEWEELPAVVDARAAAQADALQVWPPAFAPEFFSIAA